MMNHKTPLPADRNDYDLPSEREWTALFAGSAPPPRPVDIDSLFPEAITRASFRSRTPFFNKRNPMFRRIAVLASATAGVIAIAVLFAVFGSGAQLTFAQVAEQVAKTRSVTMKQSMSVPGKPAETLRIAILSDGLIRLDMPDGHYTIADTNGNALCVSPREKRATVMQGLNAPSINLYEIVRNIVSEKSDRLPDETLDGRKAHVFRAEVDERIRKQYPGPVLSMQVWVDAETRLPIRVEPISTDKTSKLVIYDIVFDQPLDSSLFSLDPPKGYTVTTQGKPAAWQEKPPTEKDLLAPEVIPGVGLGPVKFGMPKEEVVKLFGKPDVEDKGSVGYPSRGYVCMIGPKRGLVAISFFSQQESAFKVRDFAGKTKEGIGIGSSLKDLEKAFGKPTAVEKTDVPGATGTYVRYSKLGLEFTLFYDKVVGFMLQRVR